MLASKNRNSVPAHCTSCQSALVQPSSQKHSWTLAYPSKNLPFNRPASPSQTYPLHSATGVSLFVYTDRTWDKYGLSRFDIRIKRGTWNKWKFTRILASSFFAGKSRQIFSIKNCRKFRIKHSTFSVSQINCASASLKWILTLRGVVSRSTCSFSASA